MGQVEILTLDDPRAGYRLSARGNPYWLPGRRLNLVAINRQYLDSIVYVTHGQQGRTGGTGFLLGIEGEPRDGWFPSPILLIVTNRHTLPDQGMARIHLNTKDSRDYIDIAEDAWIKALCDDLAVAIFDVPDLDTFRLAYVPEAACLGRGAVDHSASFWTSSMPQSMHSVDIGCSVFMVGRFSEYEGSDDEIRPVLRTGTLSMMPAKIDIDGLDFKQEAFFVEMRSVAGFSGSPVFVWSNRGDSVGATIELSLPRNPRLLGIEVANVEPRSYVHRKKSHSGGFEESNDYVTANAGQTAVIPAWRLLEFVGTPEVQDLIKSCLASRPEDEKNAFKLS